MRATSESSRKRDHARSNSSTRAAIAASSLGSMGSAVSSCQLVPMASNRSSCGRALLGSVGLDRVDGGIEPTAGEGGPSHLVDRDLIDVLADHDIGDAIGELALVQLRLAVGCVSDNLDL